MKSHSPPDYYKSDVRRGNGGDCLTKVEWNYMFYWFDKRCCVCGTRKHLQADHWIARARGGTSSVTNVVPMCRRCNKQKQASPALGWLVLKCKDIKKAREIMARVEQYFSEVRQNGERL